MCVPYYEEKSQRSFLQNQNHDLQEENIKNIRPSIYLLKAMAIHLSFHLLSH